jgi:hypothetical protein
MHCSTHILHLLSDMETQDVAKKDCKLSRRIAPSSSKLVPQSKAIDDDSIQGIYELPDSWVTVTIAVQFNSIQFI